MIKINRLVLALQQLDSLGCDEVMLLNIYGDEANLRGQNSTTNESFYISIHNTTGEIVQTITTRVKIE